LNGRYENGTDFFRTMNTQGKHSGERRDGVMLDGGIRSRLAAVISRLRTYVFVEGLAKVCGFLFAGAVVQFLFDYGTHGMRWSMRAALLGVILLVALVMFWRRIIRPLRVPVDLPDVANLVERRFPQLSSVLISAVRFSRGEYGEAASNSPAFVGATVSRAAVATGGLDFSTVLNPTRARRASFCLVAITGACVLATVGAPEMTGLWFSRNVLLNDVAWPRRTTLVVELTDGEELIGARGDDLVIQAYAQGVQPREVEFFYETASGERGRESMVTVGSAGAFRYRFTLKNAQEDFRFYLRGGDHTTLEYNARLLERPRVRSATIEVVPPSYCGLAPFTLGDEQRSGEMLPGSRVVFSVEANKPIEQATLMAGTEVIAEAAGDGSRFSVTVSPEKTRTYHFALVDEVGLTNRQPVRFALRVIKDEPPRVRLKLTAAGEMITPAAILPMELEFADTYGLASAELVFDFTKDTTRQGLIPLEGFASGTASFSTSLSWSVADEGATPGERLTLFATAQDFDDVRGPNSAESQKMIFRLVTPEELLAELARREQEVRMDFERLVDAQEQLRGRALSLMGPNGPAPGSKEFSTVAAGLERRQRNLAGSVNVVRQQVDQILSELRVNQLADDNVEERVGDEIAVPLAAMLRRDFPLAADTLRQWSRDGSLETAGLVDPQQVALLSQMRAILANMIEWEGYQEAVTMLRDILRLQGELRDETEKAAERNAGDLFDDK
jgi:hypothetical protein